MGDSSDTRHNNVYCRWAARRGLSAGRLAPLRTRLRGMRVPCALARYRIVFYSPRGSAKKKKKKKKKPP